jgi:hypothetical protein
MYSFSNSQIFKLLQIFPANPLKLHYKISSKNRSGRIKTGLIQAMFNANIKGCKFPKKY